MTRFHKPEDRDGFNIAIICALTRERDAVMEMFDELWEAAEYRKAPGDNNTYSVGRIGSHSVVVARLPGMGIQEAASAATSFRSSFRNITLGLVVGVCGGTPTKTKSGDILLGDVILSTEIVDLTIGRQYDNHLSPRDTLADRFGRPNKEIRAFLGTMEGKCDQARLRAKSSAYLMELCHKVDFQSSQFPGSDNDIVYPRSYRHKHQRPDSCAECMICRAAEDELSKVEAAEQSEDQIKRMDSRVKHASVCSKSAIMSCEELGCDKNKGVMRSSLARPLIKDTLIREPMIHFGVVGSGNSVLRSGYLRDDLAEKNIIGFELEGAGVWDIFPTVVIKAVCDYADSHKSKDWQDYAAASAAACAKAILTEWTATDPLPSIAAEGLAGDEYRERQPKRRKTVQDETADTQHLHLDTAHSQQYDEDKYKTLSKSLRFPGMDSRVNSVRRAMISTCEWLLDHEDFKKWYYSDENDWHNGFLWIKGKPGCGKSTLMKTALEWARKKKPPPGVRRLLVPYFFNARASTSLEKSASGLYRTVAYHLLFEYKTLRPIFMNRFLHKDTESSKEEWSAEELQDFLCESVDSEVTFKLCLFIDALDEAEYDGDVRRMINFLIDLLDRSLAAGTCQLQICLSSRHYPHISVGRGLSLTVEDQLGHGNDIQAYVSKYLTNADSPENQNLQATILRKAAHIFLWAVLAVEILNKLYDQGASNIQSCLDELPTDLSDLFREILLKGSEGVESTVLFFQWLLFGMRPLEPTELFIAIEYSRPLVNSTSPLPAVVPLAHDIIARRVLDYSHGLVELVEAHSGQPPVIQFIHETVREFLIKDNVLKTLVPALAENLAGISHDTLRTACSRYISRHDVPSEYQHYTNDSYNSNSSPKNFRSRVRLKVPFLDYAITNLLQHAERAQQHDVHQRAFLEEQIGQRGEWTDLFRWWWNILERHGIQKVKSNDLLIDVLAKQRCFSLVQTLINISDITRLSAMEGNTLELASADGHVEIVRSLLMTVKDVVPGQNKLNNVIDLTLRYGCDGTVRTSMKAVCKSKVTANQQKLDKALLKASNRGHEKVVQILLDNGADANAQGGQYGNALQAASTRGREEIVRMLLDRGADVNAQVGDYSDTFQVASMLSHEEIMHVLFDRRAEVLARGRQHGNALQAASARGRERIVQILLDRGADVNAQGGHYGNALQAASATGYKRIVQMLLDRGADVDAQREHHINELRAALKRGCERMAQVLLDREATEPS